MDTQTNTANRALQWRAPARQPEERSARWYAVTGILAVTLIAYGLVIGAWTMSMVVILAAGVYFLVRNERSHEYAVEITTGGIVIDAELHQWQDWDKFWILVFDNHYELHVSPKKTRQRDFTVVINSVDPLEVREALLSHLTEDPKQREKIFDKISRICKL